MIYRALVALVIAAALALGGIAIYDWGDGGLTDPGEPGYPEKCE